jgi:hypothetical protein
MASFSHTGSWFGRQIPDASSVVLARPTLDRVFAAEA